MSSDMEQLYRRRLDRYVTVMRNKKPDRIPIRPFVAEFTAKYAGYTDQEVTQDYQKAFAAAREDRVMELVRERIGAGVSAVDVLAVGFWEFGCHCWLVQQCMRKTPG